MLGAASGQRPPALRPVHATEITLLADHIRLRARRLARIHASQGNRIGDTAEDLVLALYRDAAPAGWSCGWCDASVACDGALRRVGVGILILDAGEQTCIRLSQPVAECEPFDAEIAALESALRAVVERDHGARGVRIYTDCDALTSLWLRQRGDHRLRGVRELARLLRRFELRSLPRRHNQIAHRLARDAALRQVSMPHADRRGAE